MLGLWAQMLFENRLDGLVNPLQGHPLHVEAGRVGESHLFYLPHGIVPCEEQVILRADQRLSCDAVEGPGGFVVPLAAVVRPAFVQRFPDAAPTRLLTDDTFIAAAGALAGYVFAIGLLFITDVCVERALGERRAQRAMHVPRDAVPPALSREDRGVEPEHIGPKRHRAAKS